MYTFTNLSKFFLIWYSLLMTQQKQILKSIYESIPPIWQVFSKDLNKHIKHKTIP